MKTKRVPTRVYVRKIDRSVAHKQMKSAGLVSVNKGTPSFFSLHWRDSKYIK